MNVEMDADGKCSEFKSAYIYQALFPYWNETSSSLQYIFFHFFVAVVVVFVWCPFNKAATFF